MLCLFKGLKLSKEYQFFNEVIILENILLQYLLNHLSNTIDNLRR